jgi:Pectate lyase superfamily protein
MPETIEFSLISDSDLDWGWGTREHVLGDGRRVLLPQFRTGHVIASRYATFQSACAAAQGRTLLLDVPMPVASDYTVPASVHLFGVRGGLLRPASGVTVTFARPDLLSAGAYQMFDESDGGAIAFPTGGPVRADWWGADPSGVADSAAAITAALSAASTNMQVQLSAGTYLVGSAIEPPSGATAGWTLAGAGMDATVLERAAGFAGTLLDLTAATTGRFHLQELSLDGLDRTTGTIGLAGAPANYCKLTRVRFVNLEYGAVINGSSGFTTDECFFLENTTGLRLHNANSRAVSFVTVNGGRFANSRSVDIDIDGSQTSGTLVREIQLNDVVCDGAAHGSGRINLRIQNAERIEANNCHFEGGDPHVQVVGGVANNPVRFVVFSRCWFGNLYETPSQSATFDWDTSASAEGDNCGLYHCEFSEGEIDITADQPLWLHMSSPIGSATLLTGSWRTHENDGNSAAFYRLPGSGANARLADWNKADSVATRRMLEFLANVDTTNNTSTVVWSFSLATGSVAHITAQVVGQEDDGTDHAGYFLATTVANIGGTATEIGETALHTAHESAGASGWSAAATPSGALARVTVTGDTGQNVRWCAYVRMVVINADT